MLPADIERIAQVVGVIGADVEQHRQRRARMQSGASGIERQLADRNAHADGALIAMPENAFAVADDNRLDAVVARMRQNARDQILMRNGEKQSARLAEQMAE